MAQLNVYTFLTHPVLNRLLFCTIVISCARQDKHGFTNNI